MAMPSSPGRGVPLFLRGGQKASDISSLCHPGNPLQASSAVCMDAWSSCSIHLLQIDNNSVADTLASVEVIYDNVLSS